MSISKRTIKGSVQYRFIVSYKDREGNRKQKASKWYDSKTEALRAEREWKNKSEGLLSGLSFLKIAREYIDSGRSVNVPKTVKQKNFILKSYCEPLYRQSIESITPKDIRDLFTSNEVLMSKATNTKNRVRSFLHSVFRYAQTYYQLDRNPVDAFPAFRATDEERLREMNIYTPAQFEQFLAAIPGDYEEYRDFFYVLYWTGMRFNEANSLTFNDISPKRIRLYRQFADGMWRSLKTVGSARNIAIDKKLYQVFERLRAKWQGYPGYNSDWFCFGGYRQLAYTSAERVKNRAVRDSGLPKIRMHDFRHSHASNLIEAGVNIYKISKRLGHSSISITLDRYGHLIDDEGDEILSAIANR